MKGSTKVAVCILGFVSFGLFIHFTNEYDPAYQQHSTTWSGQSGYYGQLQHNGWYVFYDRHSNTVAYLPAGEAFYLH